LEKKITPNLSKERKRNFWGEKIKEFEYTRPSASTVSKNLTKLGKQNYVKFILMYKGSPLVQRLLDKNNVYELEVMFKLFWMRGKFWLLGQSATKKLFFSVSKKKVFPNKEMQFHMEQDYIVLLRTNCKRICFKISRSV